MKWLLLVVFAYLLGSVPTGLIVARVLGRTDPRSVGSGNIGATNVGRFLGKKAGITTLLGDALKGFVPTVWALAAFDSAWAVATVALAAYLGHLFPIYLGFKGGKGVATGLGVFLAVSPGAVFWAAVIFALVLWMGKMVSLGSLAAASALPLILAFFKAPFAIVCLGILVGGFTVWKHQSNIQRILAGTEHRIGDKA